MKYYDKNLGQLVYIERKADQKFWEDVWNSDNLQREIIKKRFDLFMMPTTKKYLRPGSRVLEGGCGLGFYVYALNKQGYDCVGVDYARETVDQVVKAVPGIKVQYGDVRTLDFPSDSFDGYWSIGVIEHFFTGYQPVVDEMKRVIKKDGYLFLTFPYMSPMRKIKAKLGAYQVARFSGEPEHFYQFAMDHRKVIEVFKNNNFELVKKSPFDGLNGLRDEVGPFNSFIKLLVNYQGNALPVLGIKYLIYKLFQPVSSHAILLVFRKR